MSDEFHGMPIFLSPPEKPAVRTIPLLTVIRDENGKALHIEQQMREVDADGKVVRLVGQPTKLPLR